MSSGYIYLLRPLRSITSNEEIYKIGKTKRKNFKRFNEYPSGSILLLQSSCENCDLMESKLLKIFDEHFIKETDYGREYFKGDVNSMKKIINSEIINEVDLSNINSIEYFIQEDSLQSNEDNLQENETNENKNKYYCNICCYYTSRKSSYDKHLLTELHNNKKSYNYNTENNLFICICGKNYKYKSGLCKHKNSCFIKNSKKSNNSINRVYKSVIDCVASSELVELYNIKKENYEIKKFLVEQSIFQQKMLEQAEISKNQTYIHNEKIIEKQKESNKLIDIMVGIMKNKTTISSL